MDEKIYFPKSFNEQMSWIAESVEHIINMVRLKRISKREEALHMGNKIIHM